MQSITDIDWSAWNPTEEATLLFVIQDERILLINKKRGLGAGKINGPGGRIDPGETPEQCAVREVQEELCITPGGLEFSGILCFQFVDGYALRGYVYRASSYEGTPTETDEAKPLWCTIAEIPFDQMWADDPLWFPHLLSRTVFDGVFIFDGDTMVDHRITTRD